MKNFVSVSVPASSGNLGPGFDVLGLALDLRNDLYIDVLDSKPGRPVVRIIGEGEDDLPYGPENVIYKTISWVFAKVKRKVPRVKLICRNRIPLARGLGSSSAAYLTALLGANRLLGNKFSQQQILNWATELEGHPDNVASALFGGIRASAVINNNVSSVALPIPILQLVLAVPDFHLSTKKARAVLPKNIPMKDAVSNLSSVALLPFALEKSPQLLEGILNDRWHEPYRAKLIPGFYRVKKAALKAGAYGMTLSGAGPSLLAFSPRSKKARVGQAMKNSFARSGVSCRILELMIDQKGAMVR